ncbi:hypothetical protein O6H91_20G005200 [Diphasiastrum complanatum]|nr:hypothetical protein O6H91_20G005200 [Diphasiastrum complanatum]
MVSSSVGSDMQVNSKRQRRPSVRLGEIGDEPMPLVLEKLFKRRKPQRSPENAVAAPSDYVHRMMDRVGTQRDPTFAGMARSKAKRVRPFTQAVKVTGNDENGNELLDERFEDKLQAEDGGPAGDLQPLRRVHVGLKKRTKRGKHGRRKRVIASRAVVNLASAKSVKVQEENSWEIAIVSAVDGASDAIARVPCSAGNLETLETNIQEFDHPLMEQKVNHDCNSLWKENDEEEHLVECETEEKVSPVEGGDLKPQDADEPKHERSVQEGAIDGELNPKAVRDPEMNTSSDLDATAATQKDVVTKANEEVTLSVGNRGPELGGEVARWLEALNLGKYADLFELHEVDDDVLPLLTIEDLREMGIAAVGTRRKMFAAIQALGHKEFNTD